MLEPPSDQLVRLFRELRLCTPRDLRRCRRGVRRLAHDLPAFDSVWLDALVQLRKLTPFQARILESDEPQRLRVGPCVLVDRLGGGPQGSTYLARSLTGQQLCALKLVECPDEYLIDTLGRFDALLRAAGGWAHPSIVAPHTCDRLGQQLALVSRYVPGRLLTEMLIRRGRYPAAIVWDIGRQLLDGLAAFHNRGQFHGDIRLGNVRLTAGGVAVLVDAGVQPALMPELTAHSNLSPDRYDGIAPELIGTGRHADERSDLYGLGCLLWHLLAGRPPYPGGDPLAKLAAHQTRQIADVREWAPDTPAALAESIRALTSRHPDQRPPNAAAVLQHWGAPRAAGRRRLQSFYASFETAPRPASAAPSGGSSNRLLICLLLFAVSGAAVGLSDRGASAPLLRFWTQVAERLRERAGASPGENVAASTVETAAGLDQQRRTAAKPALLPLPAPNEHGLVLLDAVGPYEAADISVVGSLVIRGKAGLTPEIRVTREPLSVWATHVRLENVHLRSAACFESDAPFSSNETPGALLLVQAQNLELHNCTFQTHPLDGRPAPAEAKPIAVAWKMFDPADPSGGMVEAENVVLAGRGPGLFVSGPVKQISCRNCLKLGGGVFLNLASAPKPDLDLLVKLTGVTCREAGSLLRWQDADRASAKSRIVVEAADCVFDLQTAGAALFEFAGATLRPNWQQAVQMLGEDSLASPGLAVAAWSQIPARAWKPLDADELELEGISTAAFEFAGPLSMAPDDSALQNQSFEAPRRSPHPPGITPTLLARP